MNKVQHSLKDSFLFHGLSESVIMESLEKVNPSIQCFERGDVILSPESHKRKIGFVLSGTCDVKRIHSDGTELPLNTISKYGSFGIISVFREADDFPTCIIAKTKTEIAFFEKEDLLTLMRHSPDISINVAEFLADRVAFLNEKVNTFTGSTCEKKLARELLNMSRSIGSMEFPLNRKRTAEVISCGRASLYRALESLKLSGLIDYGNKKIYIKDLNGLERMEK